MSRGRAEGRTDAEIAQGPSGGPGRPRVTATAWDALAPEFFDGLCFCFSILTRRSYAIRIRLGLGEGLPKYFGCDTGTVRPSRPTNGLNLAQRVIP
jgi:hypothetical protein